MAGDYGGMPTRYGAMFGTPERAARTLRTMCDGGVVLCYEDENIDGVTYKCPIRGLCEHGINRTAEDIADWLRGGYMGEKVRDSLGH